MHQHLTLFELNQLVRETIELQMPDEYWVEAELSDIHDRGHCYMDLIQKDARSNTPIAKARAICWSNKWRFIKSNFERVTRQEMHVGMKVLLKVQPTFHEAYGFSYQVTDVDPTYTLGDMARKRQEIIQQLQEEGVFDLQKELVIPTFAQRIAVISSESAAGYGDFCHQLADNEYGFRFQVTLFPAVMQGEQVEQSIILALNAINDRMDDYDVVVIIRGGGATADLSGFDTLKLAENVANFPLPIITGIGHDRDESILDLISNTKVKTPTAAAAFLIDHLAEVYTQLKDAEEAIVSLVNRRMEVEKMRLEQLADHIPQLYRIYKTEQLARLKELSTTLHVAARMSLQHAGQQLSTQARLFHALGAHLLDPARHQLRLLAEQVKSLDPQLLLQRGYSITLSKGRVVRDPKVLTKGEEIETRVEKGVIHSIVK